MAEIITTDDLPTVMQSDQMAEMMVAGANARASRVAPCLAGTGEDAPTAEQVAEAKLVLVGAVRRWHEAGAGALSAQTAGPFSQTIDTRQRTGYNLWPSEIEALQSICATEATTKAFVVDTVADAGFHSPVCSIYVGSASCSCGAVIAGTPIYELP